MQVLIERKKFILYSDDEARQEKYLSILACLIFASSSIIHLFNSIVRCIIPNTYKLDTLFLYCILFYIAFCALKLIFKRNNYSGLFLLLAISILCLLSVICFPFDVELVQNIFIEVLTALPWFFVAFAVHDFNLLKRYLRISAYIVLCCTIFQMLLFGDIFTTSYSQAMGYTFLPVCLILLDSVFEKIKILDLICFLIAAVLLLAMGARGPLGALAVYFCIRLAYLLIRSKWKGFIAFIFICLISILFVVFYDEILMLLRQIFVELGLSTRVVDALLEHRLLLDATRKKQYLYVLELIKQNPFGYGVGYDRILICQYMEGLYSAELAYGWYSHNIILDLFLNFGLIGGGAIFCGLVYLFIKNIFVSKDSDKKRVVFIFIALGFIPLLVSGYFLENTFFMFLLGLMMGGNKAKVNADA